MNIYCAHSSGFDYEHEWYDVLRNSEICLKNACVFPHESVEIQKNSKSTIESCDCVIAEVSHPSTGMGIELGWAETFHKPVFCFYREGTKPSASLQTVSKHFISYSAPSELIQNISHLLSHEMNNSH